MARYLITYLGSPQPASPEEGQQHFAKYKKWLESLGDAAISPANPLKNTRTIGPDGSVDESSATNMSGYTIINAESDEDANRIASDCPFLEIGGSLEVSEIIDMKF